MPKVEPQWEKLPSDVYCQFCVHVETALNKGENSRLKEIVTRTGKCPDCDSQWVVIKNA
jgi:Zn finger protein HypA/HybF involved in hydrogenase expression